MPAYLLTWLHLLAALTLMGGMVFVQLVLNPALKELPAETQRSEVLRRVGRRFRTVAWVSLITLILTGAYQMLNESGSARIETDWGVILMLKLFLFAIAFGLILVHDFIIDPYAPASKNTTSSNSPAASARADNLQKAALVMMLAVLLVASYLTSM